MLQLFYFLQFSTFLTISIAVERYLAVCKPHFHRDIKGTFLGSAWIHFTISAGVAGLINLPKWFETTSVEVKIIDSTKNASANNTLRWITKQVFKMTELRGNPDYIRYGMNFPRWIFNMIGPLILLSVFSVLTGVKLRNILIIAECFVNIE
ncbi:uncharacterized protein LOC111714361 [Eurytemora carolleeae]|uniref:uncharacterized protein LOC111714361 n=1 Tax=Eurytemora carolleeae TaxID=1294199 RepID=UPI000C782DB2|nr:uncharacterized protein LOC111714361 [Eurytemora carolleeae]|eukprot:XP_023345221.1 uncharacterized protein LOC111714361 [Eurytemora affinis]